MRKQPAKRFIVETDNEGALPITAEMEPDVKIGDEYATWKEGEKIMLVFTKVYRDKIPKQAHRGKVEPGLPKIPVPLPAILHLNLHREFFSRIAAGTKRIEYRQQTAYWKTRLENRKYDAISFRNGYAKDAPEMLVEFRGVRQIRKWGKPQYAIQLGHILKIKRWRLKAT